MMQMCVDTLPYPFVIDSRKFGKISSAHRKVQDMDKMFPGYIEKGVRYMKMSLIYFAVKLQSQVEVTFKKSDYMSFNIIK